MATKAKSPIIRAEEQVGAMQAILKDWIAQNPANTELQAFKDMKPGQWDNRTNEAFTRWVIATQTAHNKANPDDEIKVDGWAGNETLRVLGTDPKTASVLKDLQDAGLDRFHHRTDAHPLKGQEVAPEIAAKVPAPGTPGGAAGAESSGPKQATQPPKSPSDSNKPTDHTPTTSDSIVPQIIGAIAGTTALGTAAITLKNYYNGLGAPPKAPALPVPETGTVPRLSAPAPAEPAAVPRANPPAPTTATPKTVTGELMPKGSTTGASEKLVTGTRVSETAAANTLVDDVFKGAPKPGALGRAFSPKGLGAATVVFAGGAAGWEYASGGNLETAGKAAAETLPGVTAFTGKTQIDRTDGMISGGFAATGATIGLVGGPVGAGIGFVVGTVLGGIVTVTRDKTDEDYTAAQRELLPALKEYLPLAAASVEGGDKIDSLTLLRDPAIIQNVYNMVGIELIHQKRETPEQEERFQVLRETRKTLEEFAGLEAGRQALPSPQEVEARRAEERKYIAENPFTLGP